MQNIKLSKEQQEEINKTLHTPGWFIIKDLYRTMSDEKIKEIKRTGELNDKTAVRLGESMAYDDAQTLPNTILERQRNTGGK